jgi:hypothetical protein
MNSSEVQAGSAKPMPRGMRIVVVIVFFFISLYCALAVLDSFTTGLMLSINETETSAMITRKSTAKGRFGTRYYIVYTFKQNGTEYARKELFTLIPKKTQINGVLFESLGEGFPIPIAYSRFNPNYNKPLISSIDGRNILFLVIGFFAFGVIALNETKSLIKKKEN